MEVLIRREDFLDALYTTQSVLVKKIGDLLYVSLKTKEKYVEFTAINPDTGIKTIKEAIIKREGEITLPLKKLYEVIKQSYTEEILIKKKEDKVNILFGNSIFVFLTLPDSINLPPIEEGPSFLIPSIIFKQMIKKTIFVAPQDERYGISGIYFEIEDGNFRVVTTDGYRLAFVEYSLPNKTKRPMKGIIPNQILGELVKILKNEMLKITFLKKQIVFNFTNTILVSGLIDKDFFNYKKIIERRSCDKILKLKRLDLLNSCQRASIMTSDESNFLNFLLKNNTLSISSSSGFGEAKEELKINYDKEEMEIAFNPQYIIDGIKSFDEEEVFFLLSTPESSGVLESKKDELKQIYLMMPIKPR